MFRNTLTTRMTSDEADALERDFASLLDDMRGTAQLENYPAAGVVIPGDVLPQFADGNKSVLLVLLPECAEPSVEAMLHGEVSVFNDVSADLLRAITFLAFNAEGNELRLATTSFIATALDYDKESLAVVIVAGESVFCRHLVPESLEAFCDDLQGAEICSDENYRPYRLYSDEELMEAAKRAEAEPSIEPAGIYTPWPLLFKRGSE